MVAATCMTAEVEAAVPTEPHDKDDADDDASTCCDSSAGSTPGQEASPKKTVAASAASQRGSAGSEHVIDINFEGELAMRLFALLLGFEHCPDVLLDGGLATDPLCKNGARVLLKRCFRLLSVAGHSWASIEVTAVHAAVYLASLTAALKKDGAELPLRACPYTLCILMFLAHSHVEDVTLPLRSWHKHLFVHHFSPSMLNSAVMSLMKKLDFKLRVDPAELDKHLAMLR